MARIAFVSVALALALPTARAACEPGTETCSPQEEQSSMLQVKLQPEEKSTPARAGAPNWYVQPPSPCQCPGSGSSRAGFINGDGCPNGGGGGCCGINQGDHCDGAGAACLCSDGDEDHTDVIGTLQWDGPCQGGLCCIKNGAACNRCSCHGETGNWGFCPTSVGGSNPRYGCCSNSHGTWLGSGSQCENDSEGR